MAESFVADRDLFADKDGKVVEANDPTKVTKIASKGATVADADVQKYGLSSPKADVEALASADEDGSGAIDPEEESARIQGAASKKSAKKGK